MNAAKARSDKYATTNTDPTMTDQSGSDDTDINLIIKRYGVYGTAPGAATPQQYGDFADLPTDLAEGIKLIRSQKDLVGKLPPELQTMSIEELMTLTHDQLTEILAPPAPTPVPKDA